MPIGFGSFRRPSSKFDSHFTVVVVVVVVGVVNVGVSALG